MGGLRKDGTSAQNQGLQTGKWTRDQFNDLKDAWKQVMHTKAVHKQDNDDVVKFKTYLLDTASNATLVQDPQIGLSRITKPF